MARQQSRLLELPGELRNRIYEYAREPCPVSGHIVQLSTPTGVPTFKPHRPLFLGLTHTCRLLRQEFRSVYMEHNTFCTRLLDSHNFIQSFATPHGIASQGNLLIDFEYGLCKLKINLLPLIRQLRQVPKIAVRAHYPSDVRCESALNQLLDTNNNGSWFESLSGCISSIMVKMVGNQAAILVTVKTDAMDLLFQREQHSISSYASLISGLAQLQWEMSCTEFVAKKGLNFDTLRFIFLP